MAIPLNYDPAQSLYIVQISMGSQFSSKGIDLDEYTRKLTYKFPKETRQKIGAIRQSINVRRAGSCTKFFGAYFTNQIGKDQLIEACIKADREMKAIDPSLHATPAFIKVDLPDLAGGSQFDVLLKSIRTQILDVVLKRVQSYIDRNESGSLTAKQIKLLNAMIDQTKPLNLVNDPKINAEIETMRARINASQLKELREEILSALEETKDRGAALEIVADIPLPSGEEDKEQDQISRAASTLPNTNRDLDLV